MPVFCRTTFYYSLYYARGLKERLIGFITFLICQRFLENWETLDAAGKIAVLEGISPVMKEMLYTGTAGLLGLMTILTLAMRGWPLLRSITVSVSTAALAAVFFAGLHSCCLIPGLLSIAMSVLLGSMVWAGCILIVKSKALLLHKEFQM